MSKEYTGYIKEHVKYVNKALEWMADHHLLSEKFKEDILSNPHDDSKWEIEEYDAYDDYFYGKEGKDEDDIQVIDKAFDYAWLHHIHRNPHHWQYWVLIGDDESQKALEMEIKYIYEMIADWWSFSWKKGDLYEIFRWYEDHKGKIIMAPGTKTLTEGILNEIRDILDREGSMNGTDRNESGSAG